MNFSIIIPTKDRKEILLKSLKCIDAVTNVSDLEVIIINDSDLPLDLDVSSFRCKIRLFKNSKKGVASARNLGAEKAEHHHLIFMDDDMLVVPDTFEKLEKFWLTHSNCCLN